MKISTKSGHLTTKDKRVIAHMIDQKMTSGKSGRKTFYLSNEGDLWTVRKVQKDHGMIPVPGSILRESVYTSTFTVKS